METPTAELLERIVTLERKVSKLRNKIKNSQPKTPQQPKSALDIKIDDINHRIRWDIECGVWTRVMWFGDTEDELGRQFAGLVIDRLSKQGLLVEYDGRYLKIKWGPEYVPV